MKYKINDLEVPILENKLEIPIPENKHDITKKYLLSHNWRESPDVIYKDFRDWKNEKFRIGWNPKTHILYAGYGQVPIKVNTIDQLHTILKAYEFYDEVLNLMDLQKIENAPQVCCRKDA